MFIPWLHTVQYTKAALKQTKAISFDSLDSYTRQYFAAPKEDFNLRYFDLITSDVKDRRELS